MKIRPVAFGICLLTAIITYFTRSSLTTVSVIRPECYAEPVQTPATVTNIIAFSRDGFRYQCTPLFDYSISGLVVRKLNYSWFAIDRSDKAFPVDLCIVWGENVRQKYYREKTVKFSQDCRFCFAQWGGNVPFQFEQLSNNHLVISDPKLEARLKNILAGDQVRVRGKLVNVKGQLIGEAGQYDSESVDWKTSTTRTDSGPGACEVIYVESVEVLQYGNSISRLLFSVSLFGMAAVVVWGTVVIFRP